MTCKGENLEKMATKMHQSHTLSYLLKIPHLYNVIYLGCVDEYLGYDIDTMNNGYDCKNYMVHYTSDWSKKVKSACKSTCSHYAAEYCYQNSCKG